MAYHGVLNDVKSSIEHGKPKRNPAFALTEEFDVKQYGLTYEEYSNSSENIANVHINAVKKYDYDWACVYIDDCLEYEPLGVETHGEGNIPKSVSRFIEPSYQNLKKLEIPNPYKDGRMPLLIRSLEKIKKTFGDTVFLCGRTPAPFSAVTLLYGVQATMLLLYDNPKLLKDTMEFLAEVEFAYAKAQIKAGADALWIGDCSASSRFISINHYRDFVKDITKKYIKKLKEINATTIYFAAEKEPKHLVISADTKPDIIGLSEKANMVECKKAVGDKVCLMGNLDPINIVKEGTSGIIRSEVKKLINSVAVNGNYLFNTGEGIPRNTPKENVKELIKAVKSE